MNCKIFSALALQKARRGEKGTNNRQCVAVQCSMFVARSARAASRHSTQTTWRRITRRIRRMVRRHAEANRPWKAFCNDAVDIHATSATSSARGSAGVATNTAPPSPSLLERPNDSARQHAPPLACPIRARGFARAVSRGECSYLAPCRHVRFLFFSYFGALFIFG